MSNRQFDPVWDWLDPRGSDQFKTKDIK